MIDNIFNVLYHIASTIGWFVILVSVWFIIVAAYDKVSEILEVLFHD